MALKDECDIPHIQKADTLVCIDCGRCLVNIVVIDNSELEHFCQATCPCGSVSFKHKIKGRFKVAPCSQVNIHDVSTCGNTTRFIIGT